MSDTQAETIRFLSRAESYGAVGSVERIETHAAIVFLIGDLAYKLKRAVKFPFLDYSTADLRQQACKADLILNRRTAPELYLDVCSVNRTEDGRLGLNEQGEAIDWLVVMRRFDQKALLDHIANQGRLSPRSCANSAIISRCSMPEQKSRPTGAVPMRYAV
jgi:aminoglycoside phosphotransferase family enzyme